MAREILDDMPEDFSRRDERGVCIGTIRIGGKTSQQLEQEIKQGSMYIDLYGRDMLRSLDLPAREPQELQLAILKVRDILDLKGYPMRHQLLARGEELGYERVPAETAAHLRIAYKDQPRGERLFMAMGPITGPDGFPSVFLLKHQADGLWLYGSFADPGGAWGPNDAFAFADRK